MRNVHVEKREIRNDLVKQRYNERKEKGMFTKDKYSQKAFDGTSANANPSWSIQIQTQTL